MKQSRWMIPGVLAGTMVATFAVAALPATTAAVWAQSISARTQPRGAQRGDRDRMKANSNAAIVTEDGPLKGVEMGDVNAYLGIPYAAPPVGKLRWMPPRPHGKFHGVFQANTFGSACTQADGMGGTLGNEDCLTLNVFTPIQRKNGNKNDDGGLPVMVWIHGGGLVNDSSFYYDPSPMVSSGNVIVVTINYRLGFLGFFAHPAIDAEDHLSGNYGLMDQQFVLHWVQQNIGAFGGDRHRVTIFGTSAGGQSVYAHLASPTATGLFQRAIAQSGAYTNFQDYFDLIVPLTTGELGGTSSVPSGTSVAAIVGCLDQTAECLRAVPASTLVLAEPDLLLYPFVDGTILTQTPAAAFASGQFNRVPVISGDNHDEYRTFVAAQYDDSGHPLVTAMDYDNAVADLFGPLGLADAVGFLYPLADYPSPGVALGASGTDAGFACPGLNAVRLLASHVKTYAYEFNDQNAPDLFDPPATFPLGAYHFGEVPYLFDINERFAGSNPFTPAQQRLSATMIGYWTQFAATGDPNFAAAPVWSPYSAAIDQFQSLVPPAPSAESGFDADHKCSSFWSTF